MAQRVLAVFLRDVDLGIWRPSEPDRIPAQTVDSTFHKFASDWYAGKAVEVEKNTASYYRNDLTHHLLPLRQEHHLSQITVGEVDRYRRTKVREAAEITAAAQSGTPLLVACVDRLGRSYRRRARPLSARSINMQTCLLRSSRSPSTTAACRATSGRQAAPAEGVKAAARAPQQFEAAVTQANRLVAERGLQPLPLGFTPHKLRHTFASILVRSVGTRPT